MPKKLKPMDKKADLSKVRVAPTKKKKEPSEWIKLAQKTNWIDLTYNVFEEHLSKMPKKSS